MKSLFGKVLAGALGFAAAIGISAFAADITGLKAEVPAEIPAEGTATVTVTGKIAPGAEATILVAEESVSVLEAIKDSEIQYINQDSVDSEGNFKFNAVLKVGAKYNVWCGGTDVAQVGKDQADLTIKGPDSYKVMGTITLYSTAKFDTVTVESGEVKGTVNAAGEYEIALGNGQHDIVIGRPGYLYKTISVTVSGSDVPNQNVALVAGNTVVTEGTQIINGEDLNAILLNYLVKSGEEGYDAALDLNDDTVISGEDLNAVLLNYLETSAK
ncbi:MAG: hypothetical protein J1F63_04970 [Oscillospiraceae bacterium]|nr:hypothetical protein [Oscillospiraceae bacterium]